MAGFLPSVDKLQKLLESDFDKQLELMKMGKSKQVAEKYMPLIGNARNAEEASYYHQLALGEAGKFGLNQLSPMINSAFEGKKYQMTEKEKTDTSRAKLNTILGTYGNVQMYNTFKNANTSGSQYVDDWIKFNVNDGVDPLLAVTELEDAIKNNLYENKTVAGTAGQNVITFRKKGTNKLGREIGGEVYQLKYDVVNNLLYDDLNNNDKVDEGELAPLELTTDEAIQEQTKGLYQKQQTAFDNQMQQTNAANAAYGNALQAESLNITKTLASKVDVTPAVGKTNLTLAANTIKDFTYTRDSDKKKVPITYLMREGDQFQRLRDKHNISKDDALFLESFDPTTFIDKVTGEYSNKIEAYYQTLRRTRNFLIDVANSGVVPESFVNLAEDIDYMVKTYEISLNAGKGLPTEVFRPVTVKGKQWNDKDNPNFNPTKFVTNQKGKKIKEFQESGYDLGTSEVRYKFK